MTGSVTQKKLDDFSLKLFKYLDNRFDTGDKKFDLLMERMDGINGLLDVYSKEVEVYYQESLTRDAQVERLRRWVEQIAEKTGVKLEY